MIYDIAIQPTADKEIDDIVGYIAAHSRNNAERWLSSLIDAIYSLRRFPKRCPLAPEDAYFLAEVRHFVYGNYRIIFTIDRTTVRVLNVRHAARRPIGEEPEEDITPC